MTSKELNAIGDAIIGRYQAHYSIQLTDHQAKMIHLFEQESLIYLADNYPSEWEKHEYELEGLTRILRHDQLEQFKVLASATLRKAEQEKEQEDKEQIQYVAYLREVADFFEKEMHPLFFNSDSLFRNLYSPEHKSKVEYIRAEYKRFLDLAHKRAIINHFRYNRNFQPNMLQVLRLKNKIRHLNPDYQYFYHQTDAPTKAIADILIDKLSFASLQQADFYKKMQLRIFSFYEDLNSRYPGSTVNFAHSKYHPEEERPLKSWTTTLVLMDKDKYGLDHKF